VAKSTKNRRMSFFSRWSYNRKIKKDEASRKKAEYLAKLPKDPIKRFFYKMNPKRVAKFWFSKQGGLTVLKIIGIIVAVIFVIFVGAYAYFRKDVDKIQPSELAKSVQTTVSRYYDRNGKLLWEDKGSGNYKLVVSSSEISNYLKEATVSIEDKDFYKHSGFSITGTLRAAINDLLGKSVQGGSTLTQQLVKQVFFADEASDRGISGIPRKIKEIILAEEVERMYTKDQIITLYLNESPYGGRRNGAESAAQTYFGKSAKDLTLAEAALLAAIPQDPTLYNPYNVDGHKYLLARQQIVLDNMASQGYITKAQATEAKKVSVLDELKPESDQYTDIKAPHFVEMVRDQLKSELGSSVVGKGGLTVKTTLDLDIQTKLESEMTKFFASSTTTRYKITNGAATIEDTATGQIVAMLGSRSFDYPGYGQDNAAIASIQTGSTIKPFVYAKLFEDKGTGSTNYGTGSILADKNIDSLYGATLRNWDNKFMGNLTIRKALALSRNVPAVEAMYINGIQPTLGLIHSAGVTSYCTQEEANGGIGLSSAIGACGATQLDLVNGYATLSRMGVYKPTATVLEVKNSNGDVLKKWSDTSGKQVMDPQIAYMIGDILSDDSARTALHGAHAAGLYIPGVKTAAKTGTSDKNGYAKDLWIMNYGAALSMGLWLGNSDSSTLATVNSDIGGSVVGNTLEYAYKTIYANEGKWKSGDWLTKPSNIQTINNELFPSWYNKTSGSSTSTMTFDKVSKYKATSCTPSAAQVQLTVTKSTDPITKSDVYIAPDGYDATKDDNVHNCSDQQPSISTITYANGKINVTFAQGTNSLSSLKVDVNGTSVGDINVSGSGTQEFSATVSSGQVITATVTDSAYYTGSKTFSPTSSN